MCFLKKPLILSYAQNFTIYLHELAKQPIIKSLQGIPSDLPLVLKGKIITDISKCVDRANLQTLRLEGFHAVDITNNTASVCMFNLFQPISVQLSNKAIQSPTVKGPLADLRFTGFRLSSLSPFIPNIGLQEGELAGVINFNYSNEDLEEKSVKALGIKVMATEQMKLKNLSVSHENTPMLKQVSVEATPNLFYNSHTLQAKVNGLLLQDSAKAELAKADFQVSLDPEFKRLIPEFKLNASANLGQFKQQPCMQALTHLAAGNISIIGTGKESRAKEHAIQMEIVAKDLQNKAGSTMIKLL